LRRALAVAGAVAIAASIGACDDDEPPVVPPDFPTGSPAAPTPEETGLGLPPVVSVAPQPEPIEASFGETVTLTGASLFGDESATIEVTLAEPVVVTEVELDNDVIYEPDQEVFMGLEVVLEGVDGVYNLNPLDFHLVPAEEAASFSAEAFQFDDATAAEGWALDGIFEPGLSPAEISAGARVSGHIVFDVAESATEDAAVVLEPLLLVEGPPSAYWLVG
jgi:hypothetical protein